MRLTIPKTITHADIKSLNLNAATEVEYDYSGNTTYSADDVRKVSFQSDESAHIVPVKLFKALKSTNSYPPDNCAGTNPDWEDLGAVNQHKMFDEYINTQAVADGTEATDAGKLVLEIDSSKQDNIGLFNVEGTKVTFELKDSSDTVVHTKEYGLSDIVYDWEEYFYNDFDYTHDLGHTFTRYLVSSLKITIEHESAGKYPAVGYLKVGKRFFVGTTFNEPGSGIMDFSTTDRGDDGSISMNVGPYAKRMNLDVRVKNEDYDKIQKTVALVRGQPTIFEGLEDTDYESFTVLGFVKNFDQIMPGSRNSECTFEIEGLI